MIELIGIAFIACVVGALYDLVYWAIWGRKDPYRKWLREVKQYNNKVKKGKYDEI